MADKILTILQKTRRLFKNKNRWTQGFFAVDRHGNAETLVEAGGAWNDPKAFAFCIRGGIHRSAGTKLGHGAVFPPYIPAELYLESFLSPLDDLACFNNNTTHRKVLKLLDKAIDSRKTMA